MQQHDVVVVGGGNAGISLAARLRRDGVADVAVVTAARRHVYRPLLNYVGAGEASMRSLEQPMAAVVPDGCTWVRDDVRGVDPDAATVRLRGGGAVGYRTLVLAPGMVEDWADTPGLRAACEDGWAASTFVTDAAPRVWPALSGLRRGRVLFTVPPEPAPCGATALKPLFMACDHWRRAGVLADLDVTLVLPGRAPVGVGRADRHVERHLRRYGVTVLRDARVAAVDHRAREVTVHTAAGEQVLADLDHAHVVPHYRAPRWVADSGLAADPDPGLVDVDPTTLRHRRHPDVWALGDVAALGTRPSGGALRPQVDVLARNLAAPSGQEPLARYDGYTVAPVTTSRRRLVLVEHDRDGRPSPSVPFPDLLRPRLSTWLVDRYVLPVVYRRRILRGRV